ncbi:MAG: hypothetical protein QMD77_01235 [Patescibacteria group bacterium]|nr:hypothetical protein [Patescibacteria group bacterium]
MHINPTTRIVDSSWSGKEIDDFFENLFDEIKKYPKVITIAISPWYMGGTDISDNDCLKGANTICKNVEKKLYKFFSWAL